MLYIMDNLKKIPYYVLFLFLFILAQSLSMWGQYVTLPYKHLSMWEAYKMAIPFAWLDWIIMTFTVMVGDKYNLVTPTQDTFLLIIIQFSLILIINNFYLKQKVTKSDIIAFFIILFGFFVSFLHLFSKTLGFIIPQHLGTNNPDTITATLKTLKYRFLANTN
jgi:cytochrome bd-type quinol oxidase subunit 2